MSPNWGGGVILVIFFTISLPIVLFKKEVVVKIYETNIPIDFGSEMRKKDLINVIITMTINDSLK